MNSLLISTRRPPPREEIRCAYCRGRGTDPFNILSDRSVCGACGGRGQRIVTVPNIPCAYCDGSGSFKTFRCPVCDGAGVVPAPDGPTQTCSDCDGLAFEHSSGLVCLACQGRGTVPAES